MAAEKGADLTADELWILDQRVAAARVWLEDFAPDTARLAVTYDEVPAAVAELDEAQREFLATLEETAGAAAPASGEAWQALVFQVARDKELPAGQAFGAVYRAFLGRSNGPRAGWLLASLAPEFVRRRLADASGMAAQP
jgi:lysyl-tRNA synthetase class 1